MRYKIVVSDLDGTLLNSQHRISDYTVSTIRKLEKKGIKFVIATGRHYEDAKYFFNQIGVAKYLISGNGSFIHSENWNEIGRESIDRKLIKTLLELEVEEGTSRSIYKGKDWYTDRIVQDYIDFHKESKYSPQISNLDKFKNVEAEKIFFINPNRKVIEKLEKKMKNLELDKYLNIATSQPTCLEIMSKKANKGEALKTLLKYENIDFKEIISFGDALNDKEMLENSGMGIIMGNGDKRLKEILKECKVIESSDEDAAAKFLENLFDL